MVTKIINITKEVLKCENVEIGEKDDLIELGLDSLKAIELVVGLEAEFNIMIDEDDLLIENLSTILNIRDLVDKYMEEA